MYQSALYVVILLYMLRTINIMFLTEHLIKSDKLNMITLNMILHISDSLEILEHNTTHL